MTSFATAGGGIPAVTSLLPGKVSYIYALASELEQFGSFLRYVVNSGALRTVIDVTGSGYLTFAMIASDNDTSTNSHVIITIDGVEVLNDTKAADLNPKCMSQVGCLCFESTLPFMSYDQVRFNKSLKIEAESDDTAYYYYNYFLT